TSVYLLVACWGPRGCLGVAPPGCGAHRCAAVRERLRSNRGWAPHSPGMGTGVSGWLWVPSSARGRAWRRMAARVGSTRASWGMRKAPAGGGSGLHVDPLRGRFQVARSGGVLQVRRAHVRAEVPDPVAAVFVAVGDGAAMVAVVLEAGLDARPESVGVAGGEHRVVGDEVGGGEAVLGSADLVL